MKRHRPPVKEQPVTTSPLRRAATVTALAGLALGGAVGIAGAQTPTHTSLSIRSARAAIVAGGHDTVSGVLLAAGHPLSGASVVLRARPAGAAGFHAVATHPSGSNGAVAFVVSPARTTAYQLAFRGDPADAASRSGIVTLAVRPDERPATSLSIRISRTAIDPGGSAVVSGVLIGARHPLADRRVVLQTRHPGDAGWYDARVRRTGPHGFVAFVVRPATLTRYRLEFRPHPDFRGSRSGVVTLNVRTPTTLTLAADTTSVDAGTPATLTGTLTTAAGPVAGRPVALLARPASATSFARIASATTAADGTVPFTVTPNETTRYVLVSPRSYRLVAARSAALTIMVRKPSSLSIRAVKDSISAGESDTIAGTLLGEGGSALGGRTVTLVSRPAGGSDAFTTVSSATTNDHGYVAFTVTPGAATDYELVFGGGNRYDGCHSGVVSVSVS
jgi:hypothetical protein